MAAVASAIAAPSPPTATDWARRAPPDFPPVWASAWGSDRYGLWAEFRLAGNGKANPPQPDIVQRLRWIEAGAFLIGSPDDEAGRFDDEGPQHVVTISQGFWLADTACSQALWQAVMGENPSHFHADDKGGPNHPVETVSWNDIARFLPELLTRLPSGQGEYLATLPTEAEWEYACRADGVTAYHFGDEINQELANYGDNAGRTLPVNQFARNDWGLYQMHGNVWEWCADNWRDYLAQDEFDPGLEQALNNMVGSKDDKKVLRGGGWINHAQFARSAYRVRGAPGGLGSGAGFRLALRFHPGK